MAHARDVHHAVIVNSNGVYGLNAQPLTSKPVDSIELFEKLLNHLRLGKMAPKGVAPQIWVVGNTVCEHLGWTVDYEDAAFAKLGDDATEEDDRRLAKKILSQHVVTSLLSGFSQFDDQYGWTIRRPKGTPIGEVERGALIPLVYNPPSGAADTPVRRFQVDVFIEPWMLTLTGRDDLGILGSERDKTTIPDDEWGSSRELARRLRWSIDQYRTLPSATSAMTASSIADTIKRDRERQNKQLPAERHALVVSERSPLPPTIDKAQAIEAPTLWQRRPSADELERKWLLVLDQRASYLAAVASLNFGWGTPDHASRSAAEDALRHDTIPFGLWRLELPALAEINADPRLPPVLPPMQRDRRVTTWVTTPSVLSLLDPVSDGGAGLDIDDLWIDEAWFYPHRGRALDAWAKRLRLARAAALEQGDSVMKQITGSIYKAYVGRMVNEDMWQSEYKQHHYQPVWHYAVIADARRRGRRQAMNIAAEHPGLYPVASQTDSWTYLCDDTAGMADTSGYLGRLEVELVHEMTAETRSRIGNDSLHELVTRLKKSPAS